MKVCVQEVMGHLEKVREERAQDKQAKQEKAQVGTLRILLLTCYHPYLYKAFSKYGIKYWNAAFIIYSMMYLHCADPDRSVLNPELLYGPGSRYGP